MQRIIFLISVCFLSSFGLIAQISGPTLISSSGEISSSSTITLDWSLGEIMVESVLSENGIITQGFHQPLLSVVEISGDNSLPDQTDLESVSQSEWRVDIWPNPVQSILSIRTAGAKGVELLLDLRDITGKSIKTQKLPILEGMYELDMSSYPAGNFLLRICNIDHSEMKTYQINKQ